MIQKLSLNHEYPLVYAGLMEEVELAQGSSYLQVLVKYASALPVPLLDFSLRTPVLDLIAPEKPSAISANLCRV